jgi:hypothetical protein
MVSAIRVAREAVKVHLLDDMRQSIQQHLDQFETVPPAP